MGDRIIVVNDKQVKYYNKIIGTIIEVNYESKLPFFIEFDKEINGSIDDYFDSGEILHLSKAAEILFGDKIDNN